MNCVIASKIVENGYTKKNLKNRNNIDSLIVYKKNILTESAKNVLISYSLYDE